MFTRLVPVALWSVVAAASVATAHDDLGTPSRPGAERVWTHASGRHRVVGSFVAASGDSVRIRTHDGEPLDLRLEAMSHADRQWVRNRLDRLATANLVLASRRTTPVPAEPEVAAAFRPFAATVKTRLDDDFLYVESNGMPDHRMMVGITAWQQQVPIPQPYTGENAWRVPLRPVPAKNPMSAKENFFRGAIALAVNGVPIFNPIKNDGRTDTFLAGELDEFGGHCGRADDYHYHTAPVHLEPKVGKGRPIGYALDGYAIHGFDEPDGAKVRPLDKFNGHDDPKLGYHYHATKTYPYLNGGFHGEVVERDGQVDPQPRAEGVREALPPLRGAKITGFEETKPGTRRLTYEIRGRKHFVDYTLKPEGGADFVFTDPDGRATTESYGRRQRGPGQGGGSGGGGGRGRPPQPEEPPPPREGERRAPPPAMSALDRDGDGALSRREIADAAKSLLTLDHDKDGRLSADELRPEPPPPRPDAPAPPRNGQGGGRPRGGPPRDEEAPAPVAAVPPDVGRIGLMSPAFANGGNLPVEFTCDGAGISPPIEWSELPPGTKSVALTLWHVPRDGGEKSYWVVYNIPPTVEGLRKGAKGVGKAGLNDKRRADYDPMCSQGPGAKTYHVTVLALSKELSLPKGGATRAALLKAAADVTLARKTISYRYERGEGR